MSIKAAIPFLIVIFVPSGSDTIFHADLLTDPVLFAGGLTGQLSPFFDISKSLPTGLSDVSCAGLTIDSATLDTLLGVFTGGLTVTFHVAPSMGSYHTISGYLNF